MAARVTELCEAVTALLTAAVLPSVATVSRVYVPAVDPDDLAAAERVVLVWWQGSQDGGPISRGRDSVLYQIGIVTAEKYKGTATAPPTDWVDERVEWVQATIDAVLADPRNRVDGAVIESADPVYSPPDPGELLKGVFWAATVITLRDEN